MSFDINKLIFKNKEKRKNPRFEWWVVDPTNGAARYKEDIHVTRTPKGQILSGPFNYRQDARKSKQAICQAKKLSSEFSWNDDVLPGNY